MKIKRLNEEKHISAVLRVTLCISAEMLDTLTIIAHYRNFVADSVELEFRFIWSTHFKGWIFWTFGTS